MSLFPAYEKHQKPATAEECKISEPNGENRDATEWLKNSSFQTAIIPQTPIEQLSSQSLNNRSILGWPNLLKDFHQIVSLDSDSSCEKVAILSKYSTTRANRDKQNVKYELEVKNVYHEDRRREINNRIIDTLPPRARSRYDLKLCSLGFVPFEFVLKKKEIVTRYYAENLAAPVVAIKYDKGIKRGAAKTSDDRETNFLPLLDCLPNAEEEQKLLTREFNEKLSDSPHDINLWLDYVKFQDISRRFENSQNLENKTAVCQKKLSIIERGLERNNDSKELLREKLCLMGELYPADELSKHIENLVNKDTGNIFLWQAYIMVTQNSVAMCTVPKIMNLYSKCFGTLRLWSRSSTRNHDERLLEMLYHCFVFLRQAGHWEKMWETLRLNLSLNLSLNKDALRFQSSIDEKKLIELEEVILTSRLPLNQLWLRVESLRENCHWISVDRDQLDVIGDSHRFVSPEDVTDFVHPMLTRDSNMRLAIYSLITLKVPLLPTSDSILKDLGLDKCSWTIDSIESLLPMLYPTVGELAGFKKRKLLLDGLLAGGLTSGPQYLRYHPAQEPYLDFVRDAFSAIAESLTSLNRTSLYVWWLRFERMLVYLCEDEPKSETRRKKLKGILKEFLKKEENRNNLNFYREYALIEREMGRNDSCVKILEVAIEAATVNNDQTSLMSLRRTLIEVLLSSGNDNKTKKIRANRVLCEIVPGDTRKNDIELVEAYLRENFENFLSETPTNQYETIEAYFLPNPICDNVACYAYLLYANNRDISEIMSIFDACLKHTSDNKYLQERFYENQIVILEMMYEKFRGFYSILAATLNRALTCYPDNFYLLSVFAGIESELPIWKVNTLKETDRPWRALSYCLAGRARINSFVKRGIENAATAAINKLISFHRRLARSPDTQHCPLAWRLLMLLLHEQNRSQERGEEVYHESVAQCPWERSIYIDAAEVAPQVLTQIQDVIREKDLRMHVTPEELDILRG